MIHGKKYRKVPVEIEAMEFTGDNWQEVVQWIRDNTTDRRVMYSSLDPDELKIVTLEGIMTADRGDYIIRGVKNEFYPCKPDVFAKTYEEVTESEEAWDSKPHSPGCGPFSHSHGQACSMDCPTCGGK